MSQNLIDLDLNPDALAAIASAVATLETQLSGLIALDPEQRRSLTKMGHKSEAFCRQAVVAFAQNPGVLPRNFDLDGFQRDLAMLDALRPTFVRLDRLHERLTDTEMALGSDLMVSALEGYAILKVAGGGEGLDGMRKTLSARFNRSRPATPQAVPPAV